MCLSINHERARPANSFAAVVVEHDGFFAFGHQLVIQDVEHLQERGLVGDLVNDVCLKVSLCCWASLAPDLQRDVFDVVAHL